MKKVKMLMLGGLFLLGSQMFVSCDSAQAATDTKYACPMVCEGDKVYDEAGSCPVCGMDLVNTAELEETQHNHDDHHGHSH